MNPQPSSKRRKPSSDSSTATDDPARKYCLGKLHEVFDGIFTKYPHVGGQEGKALEDLTDGEQGSVRDQARRFATELEQCVYDIYSEPDKYGKSSAGGKYKCVMPKQP